jgi:hypothetical protein
VARLLGVGYGICALRKGLVYCVQARSLCCGLCIVAPEAYILYSVYVEFQMSEKKFLGLRDSVFQSKCFMNSDIGEEYQIGTILCS